MTINMTAVREFYRNYHAKTTTTNPDLYQPPSTPDYVKINFPPELYEYAEKSAGHHGYASGCKPVGALRYVPGDRKQYLDRIFSSVSTLTNFIKSCDGTGLEYCTSEYRRITNERLNSGAGVIEIDPMLRPINEYNLQALYGPGIIARLQAQYPATIRHDWAVLRRGEFEARYGLTAVESTEPVL